MAAASASASNRIFSHVGLGTGTQAALAAGMAVNRLYDMSMSVRDIAIAVGRGGTSGTGVASFESGGFILDSGHKFSEKGEFKLLAAPDVIPERFVYEIRSTRITREPLFYIIERWWCA